METIRTIVGKRSFLRNLLYFDGIATGLPSALAVVYHKALMPILGFPADYLTRKFGALAVYGGLVVIGNQLHKNCFKIRKNRLTRPLGLLCLAHSLILHSALKAFMCCFQRTFQQWAHLDKACWLRWRPEDSLFLSCFSIYGKNSKAGLRQNITSTRVDSNKRCFP